MDIQRQTSSRRSPQKILGAIFLTLVTGTGAWALFTPSQPSIALSSLRVGQVTQGNLEMRIEGFGTLQSREQRLLTSDVTAQVSQIYLRAGAILKSGDNIAELSNPELHLTLKQQHRYVEQTQAVQTQTRLNQEREILALKSALAELHANYETAKLELNAQSALSKSAVVSKLDLERTRLQVNQLERRLTLEKEQIQNLEQVHAQERAIQQHKVDQAQGELALWQERMNKLTVTAQQAGILQKMPLELGQTIQIGDQLALIGSIQSLMALVNVPQSLIRHVQLAQPVKVRIGHESITGEVTRIAPEVIDGKVIVEVALPTELPQQARPAMNIAATIHTGKLNNTLYIERPVNVRANSQAELFVVSPEEHKAQRVTVTLGETAGQHIQVLSGLSAQAQVILSDTSHWMNQSSIPLSF